MRSIPQINVEHSDWLRNLDFYKGELQILKERLTEVAGKNTGDEAAKGAEHFENQFKIQTTNIDTLRHDISQHLDTTAAQAEKSAGHVEQGVLDDHDALRERYIAEEKTINDLRHEFYRYAAKWM
ncbi:MAG: hypothetical protein KDC07_00740 [Chitinophagaceae bacterium]|nr:hypothetical protein [Chitinophagaceae bacterium]